MIFFTLSFSSRLNIIVETAYDKPIGTGVNAKITISDIEVSDNSATIIIVEINAEATVIPYISDFKGDCSLFNEYTVVSISGNAIDNPPKTNINSYIVAISTPVILS